MLVLDYLLTLHKEIRLVWGGNWGVGTVLFVLNRYLPFVDTSLEIYATLYIRGLENCVRKEMTISMLTSIGIFVSEVILILRTLALWDGNGWIATLLLTTFLGTTAAGFVFSRVWANSVTWYPSDELGMRGCKMARSNNAFIYSFVLILVMETIIVALTALRARYHLKSSNSGWVSRLYRQVLIRYLYSEECRGIQT